jgi:hypothetical protein
MRLFAPAATALMILWSITPASASSCSEAAASCKSSAGASQPRIVADCETARAQCLKTGTFVGPSSGKMWTNLQKK